MDTVALSDSQQPTRPSATAVEQVARSSSAAIGHWVYETARSHGLRVVQRPSDRFAKAVTRLSDTEVELDGVEELLIALSRSHILTQQQSTLLQICYLQ